jgi:hypothetical protein
MSILLNTGNLGLAPSKSVHQPPASSTIGPAAATSHIDRSLFIVPSSLPACCHVGDLKAQALQLMEPSDPLQDVLVDAVKPLQVELGVVDVQGQLLHFAALCDYDSAPIEKVTPLPATAVNSSPCFGSTRTPASVPGPLYSNPQTRKRMGCH